MYISKFSILRTFYKYCDCGCKYLIKIVDKQGRIRYYKDGHTNRGDLKTNQGEYIMIYKPYFKYSNSSGYVREHRYIFHIYLSILNGKLTYLPEGFDIHHINKNKKDNKIENLMLVDPLTHRRIHSECILIDNEWWKPCRKCNELKKVDTDYYKYKHENTILSWCKQCSIINVIKNKKRRMGN